MTTTPRALLGDEKPDPTLSTPPAASLGPVGGLGREVAHADWHGQEGNLLGANDCNWEGCQFIEHVEFFAGHLDAWRDGRQEAQS
jgi:hypothetical protein